MARAASGAVNVPRNLSGAARTRMGPRVQSAPRGPTTGSSAGPPRGRRTPRAAPGGRETSATRSEDVSIPRLELIGAARAEREGLGRTIQYAPASAWEAPSACPGWWSRDVVAHLASQDYSAAQLLVGERAEELDDY